MVAIAAAAHTNSAFRTVEPEHTWLPGTNCFLCQHRQTDYSSPFPSTSSPSQHLRLVHVNLCSSRKTRFVSTTVDEVNGIQTLTPSRIDYIEKRPRKHKTEAIVGGCVGASLLVVIIVVLVYILLVRVKRFMGRTSETASSLQSLPCVNGTGENGVTLVSALSPYETHNLRILTILELEHATSSFCISNIIGEGGFGIVYKGLLQDGSIVAIKRRPHVPTEYFIQEVQRIGRVCHKHLVELIGYCQETNQQFLIYKYIFNGNVGNHLYDSEGLPTGRLDVCQRLSIALGAAKGLEYLHSLIPPFIHMHFGSRNVLVDENFAARVSDFGLSKLVVEDNRAGSSTGIDCFVDPELRSSSEHSQRSDVYSFGVFLLELISGREAIVRNGLEAHQNLVTEAKGVSDFDDFADNTMEEKKMMTALRPMMKLALQCLDTGARRPTMSMVVRELELIRERELGNLHRDDKLGGEISVVTLGSELFT